jgi:hypothetical protein
MPLSAHAWTVLCRACDLVIGTVEDGRFEHDPTCASPLAIGTGVMRCCQCGGRLTAGQRPVPAPERDDDEEEEAPAFVLRFRPSSLAEGDARQRL